VLAALVAAGACTRERTAGVGAPTSPTPSPSPAPIGEAEDEAGEAEKEPEVPIPSRERLERSAAKRYEAFLGILRSRAPTVAQEVARICRDGSCRIQRLRICKPTSCSDHSCSCQIVEGNLRFRVTEYEHDGLAHLTIWTDDALVSRLQEALGEAFGDDGLRLYRDVPFAGKVLAYHPIASVIEFGEEPYLPWHELAPQLAASIGKAIPEDAHFDVWYPLAHPLAKAYLRDIGLRVHVDADDGQRVRGTAACVVYADDEERTVIWSALQLGLPASPRRRTYLRTDDFPGLLGYEYADGTRVVDYVFDANERQDSPGRGCWLVGMGQLSEDVFLRPLP